MNPENWLK